MVIIQRQQTIMYIHQFPIFADICKCHEQKTPKLLQHQWGLCINIISGLQNVIGH